MAFTQNKKSFQIYIHEFEQHSNLNEYEKNLKELQNEVKNKNRICKEKKLCLYHRVNSHCFDDNKIRYAFKVSSEYVENLNFLITFVTTNYETKKKVTSSIVDCNNNKEIITTYSLFNNNEIPQSCVIYIAKDHSDYQGETLLLKSFLPKEFFVAFLTDAFKKYDSFYKNNNKTFNINNICNIEDNEECTEDVEQFVQNESTIINSNKELYINAVKDTLNETKCENIVETKCENIIETKCENIIETKCENIIETKCENITEEKISDVDLESCKNLIIEKTSINLTNAILNSGEYNQMLSSIMLNIEKSLSNEISNQIEGIKNDILNKANDDINNVASNIAKTFISNISEQMH
jgi:hypothetical protein